MHSQIQDSLTDDLVKLAKGLKERTKLMANALDDRNSAMDTVTDALEYSVAGAKDARKKAGRSLKRYHLTLFLKSHTFPIGVEWGLVACC